MRGRTFFFVSRLALAIFSVTLFVTSTWATDHEKVLHNLGDDGAEPTGSLLMDAAGNFYGTASSGGIHNGGTVFKLTPRDGGGFRSQVLYSFGNGTGTDGAFPNGSLIMDGAGNLYGTTAGGGIHPGCENEGCGTVFELSPNGSAGWTEQVLHSFGGGTDGARPFAGLIMDGAGNLYGTTFEGGIHQTCSQNTSCGTVFELSPREGGGWTERVLHSFGEGFDGTNPDAGLLIDAAGNLYGTTVWGGIVVCEPYFDCGTAFELSPREGGGWTEKVLHSFGSGYDGINPEGALIMDGAGNLYGTTWLGGVNQAGTVFEITPPEDSGVQAQN